MLRFTLKRRGNMMSGIHSYWNRDFVLVEEFWESEEVWSLHIDHQQCSHTFSEGQKGRHTRRWNWHVHVTRGVLWKLSQSRGGSEETSFLMPCGSGFRAAPVHHNAPASCSSLHLARHLRGTVWQIPWTNNWVLNASEESYQGWKDRWLSGWRCLILPSLMTWVWSTGSSWWEGRTDSGRLFSDHTLITRMCPPNK